MAHTDSQITQGDSHRLSDTSRWLKDALRCLRVALTNLGALRDSQNTLGLLTKTLRQLTVAHKLLSGSQRLSDTSKCLRVSQIPQGGSKSLSVTSGGLTEALRHLRMAHTGSQMPQGGSQRLSKHIRVTYKGF